MPNFVEWGWPPALTCSDMVAGVVDLALDSGLAFV